MEILVRLTTATLCFLNHCYPVLIGNDTPKGTFPISLVRTNELIYGGDVLAFSEDDKYIYAIHKVVPVSGQFREKRLSSSNPKDRIITHGCINVSNDVYITLKQHCSDCVVIIK